LAEIILFVSRATRGNDKGKYGDFRMLWGLPSPGSVGNRAIVEPQSKCSDVGAQL